MRLALVAFAAALAVTFAPAARAQEEAVKPVPQESTEAERAAARAGADAAPNPLPVTAAEWARQQRVKEGLPVGEEPAQAAAPEEAARPVPQEPTQEERAAVRTEQAQGAPAAVGFGSPALDAPGGLSSASAPPRHLLELSGYAILTAAWTQSDPQLLTVGRNNGFALGDARLEITARPADKLWLFLSLDGAVAQPSAQDPIQGQRVVSLKDAYGVYAPGGHLRFQAGQFKAPQGVEELLEETDIKFASRSILSTGVLPANGYAADPLALGRQLGVGVGTDRVPLGPGGLIAQAAVTNGNGLNQLYNDSPFPSASARVAYDVHGISIGVWGAFQPRLTGTQPNVFRDNVFTGGTDMRLDRGPLHLMLLAQLRNTHHVTSRAPEEQGLGVSGEAAYRLGIVEPALRISYLDPISQVPTGAVTWVTGGLNFYLPGTPGRLSLDFTHRAEKAGRELDNDGLEAMAQVRF